MTTGNTERRVGDDDASDDSSSPPSFDDIGEFTSSEAYNEGYPFLEVVMPPIPGMTTATSSDIARSEGGLPDDVVGPPSGEQAEDALFRYASREEEELDSNSDSEADGVPISSFERNHQTDSSVWVARAGGPGMPAVGVCDILTSYCDEVRTKRAGWIEESTLPLMHYGLPVGPQVTSLTPTNSTMSYGDPRTVQDCADTWGAIDFHAPRELLGVFNLGSPSGFYPLQRRSAPRGAAFKHADAQWLGIVIGQLTIAIAMSSRSVCGVQVHGFTDDMVDTAPSFYGAFLTFLSGLQLWVIRDNEGDTPVTVLTDVPLPIVMQSVHRTFMWNRPVDYDLPTQVFAKRNRYPDVRHSEILVNHYFVDGYGGVSQARTPADEVMGGTVVAFCAHGGTQVTGTAIPVLLGASRIGIAATTHTARIPVERLRSNHKMAPAYRDSLVSALAASALHRGHELGEPNKVMVRVQVDDRQLQCDTVFTEIFASDAPVAMIQSQDPIHLLEASHDLARVLGLESSIVVGGGLAVYCPITRRSKTVAVTFGGDRSAPRWCELMPTYTHCWPSGHTGSELRLDYGCSGVGRYMLKRHTGRGGILRADKIRLTRRGHFRRLLDACVQEKRTTLGGVNMALVDYVLETACVVSATTEGASYCVYGLGLAKFVRGAYRGSACVVANNPETAAATSRNRRASATYAAMCQSFQGVDMLIMLSRIRALLSEPGVRVFTRGRLFQYEQLHPGRGGTTLFNAQRSDVNALIEVGAIALPRPVRTPYAGGVNLAHTSVDIAVQSGVCLKWPENTVLGHDLVTTLMPDGAAGVL